MNAEEMRILVTVGPRSFDEAMALKREFAICAQRVLSEDNLREQAVYLEYLHRLERWAPVWIHWTMNEIRRRERLGIPSIEEERIVSSIRAQLDAGLPVQNWLVAELSEQKP